MKIFKIVALTLVIALMLGGCSLVRVDQEKVENQVVAKVNDTTIYRYEISEDQVQNEVMTQVYYGQQFGMNYTQEQIDEMVILQRESMLKDKVTVEVLLQKAAELGITLTEEEKAENLTDAQDTLDGILDYFIMEVEQELEAEETEAAGDETIEAPEDGAAADDTADDASGETADNTDDTADDTADDSQEAADDTANTEDTADDAVDTADETAEDATDESADDTQEPEQTEEPTDPEVLAEAQTRYQAYVEQSGLTLESIHEDNNKQDIITKVRDYCIGFVEVTDEDVRTWYDQTVAKQQEEIDAEAGIFEQLIRDNKIYTYVPEGVVAVRDVVISFDDTLSSDLKSAYDGDETSQYDTLLGIALTDNPDYVSAATDVATRLANGETIEDVVEELSADMDNISETSSPEGYVIDPRTQSYSGAFVDAATGLKNVGDVSEPFSDYDGVHVLQLVKVYEPGVIAFDELKDNIKKALQPGAEEDMYNEMVEQWIEEADVKYYFDRLHSHRD